MTRAGHHGRRRIAAWVACWLLSLGAAIAAPEPPKPPLELRQAVRIGPGTEAPQAVFLPETVDTGGTDTEIIRPVYRLEADLGRAPSRIGVYLPGVFAQARIAVNGQVVSDNIVDPLPPRPRSVDRLRLLEVPPGVVRPGVNTIEIALAARRTTVMPAVWIGPIDTLGAMRERKVLLVVVLPAIVATVIGLLGAVVLMLYARRRQEPLYAYFGIGALAWALHTGWTILPRTVLSGVDFYIWWTTLYTFFVSMLVIFCLRLTRNARPEAERALWAGSLATPLVLYGANALGLLFAAADAWRLLLVGIVVVALASVARQAWRRRDASGVLLVLTGIVGAGFGLRDWLVSRNGSDAFPVVLTPYSGLLFIGLMAWILIDRFVRAADSLEVANRGLERRVARKSEELVAALEEMRLAKEAAEHANRAKSSFLAAASHDLRQPIHALGLYMATLRAERLNLSQSELVQRMSSSLSALDSMFNTLLDISRMDAGGLVPHPRPFSLETMLHRLAEEFAPLAADKGLRLSVRVAPQARTLHAVSDPQLVERIVRNLLGNAVKYTSEGGVLLSCRLRGAARWRVEVWDTGCGIPEAEREHVFDEFYQVGNPERDRANGLGLGLSIVRRLTQLLRHRLELQSQPGRGTRFVLELPVTAERPEVESPLGLAAGSLQGLAVAVVDDDPEVRDGMQLLLTRWGCQVFAGADAAEVLKRAGERPVLHAIVADFRLRDGHTGIEAVQGLRAACRGEPPALIVTGDSAPDRLAEIERSTLPWLSKPVAAVRLRGWLIQAARSRRGVDSFVEAVK